MGVQVSETGSGRDGSRFYCSSQLTCAVQRQSHSLLHLSVVTVLRATGDSAAGSVPAVGTKKVRLAAQKQAVTATPQACAALCKIPSS